MPAEDGRSEEVRNKVTKRSGRLNIELTKITYDGKTHAMRGIGTRAGTGYAHRRGEKKRETAPKRRDRYQKRRI